MRYKDSQGCLWNGGMKRSSSTWFWTHWVGQGMRSSYAQTVIIIVATSPGKNQETTPRKSWRGNGKLQGYPFESMTVQTCRKIDEEQAWTVSLVQAWHSHDQRICWSNKEDQNQQNHKSTKHMSWLLKRYLNIKQAKISCSQWSHLWIVLCCFAETS